MNEANMKRPRGRPRALCPAKMCVNCGNQFGRRVGEATTDFYARSTCSRTCARRADLTPIRTIAAELGLTKSEVYCALAKAGRKLAELTAARTGT